MTSKRYLQYLLLFIGGLSLFTVATALYLNDYGLFYSRSEVKIISSEKMTKNLLSYRYVPENFEGILIGPSFSANLQTKDLTKDKIYNLSMSAANSSELRIATERVLASGKMKRLIICLTPYITKDSGCKDAQFDPQHYWNSLFSTLPLKHLGYLFMRNVLGIKPRVGREYHSSEWGYNDFNMRKKHVRLSQFLEDFHAAIAEKGPSEQDKIYIDPIALEELKSIIDLAHQHSVQIFAYFYPIYHELHENMKAHQNWDRYEAEMRTLFTEEDLIWNMNSEEYAYITHDPACYTDSHLSNFGADQVLQAIDQKLLETTALLKI